MNMELVGLIVIALCALYAYTLLYRFKIFQNAGIGYRVAQIALAIVGGFFITAWGIVCLIFHFSTK